MTRWSRRAWALPAAAAALAIVLPGPLQAVTGAPREPAETQAEATAAASAQLAAGVAAVQAADYSSAVTALSSALRGLAQDPARQDDLVRAYLNLGVAFAGLGQESPARSQFAQALLRRPDATLDVKNPPESARRIFQEARGEAAPVIAAADERKKKDSKKGLVLAGVAAIGAGVGVATVAGGKEESGPPPTIGPINPGPLFLFSSANGNPQMSFGGGQPSSGTTIQLGTAAPRFLYRVQMSTVAAPIGPFARLQVTVDLVTLDRGPCWHAESPIFALAAGEIVQVVVDAFPATPPCAAPFTTLSVEARLFDREASRQLSNTVYSGGYKVVP